MKKHFIGATYNLTQKNMQCLIEQIERLQKQNEILREGLNRIVGMVEVFTDEYGQKNVEEIYASRICKETIARADELEGK